MPCGVHLGCCIACLGVCLVVTMLSKYALTRPAGIVYTNAWLQPHQTSESVTVRLHDPNVMLRASTVCQSMLCLSDVIALFFPTPAGCQLVEVKCVLCVCPASR